MRKEKIAILDLGTNTFHILIARINGQSFKTLYQEKIPVKLGQNGISSDEISKDAWERALNTLYYINELIEREKVTNIYSIATSAIRNAKNGDKLLAEVKDRIGLDVRIISGETEAELIYKGVRLAVNLGPDPVLIMDIGGGSVEFIIGNESDILWKRSFEIGVQRLFDRFHIHDPLHKKDIRNLNRYLDVKLNPLSKIVDTLNPKTLIGSSGTFDTISNLFYIKNNIKQQIGVSEKKIDIKSFIPIHNEIISKDRAGRLQIPGMAPMRADMVAVASCLINFIIKRFSIHTLIASSYSMKEGVLANILESEKPAHITF